MWWGGCHLGRERGASSGRQRVPRPATRVCAHWTSASVVGWEQTFSLSLNSHSVLLLSFAPSVWSARSLHLYGLFNKLAILIFRLRHNPVVLIIAAYLKRCWKDLFSSLCLVSHFHSFESLSFNVCMNKNNNNRNNNNNFDLSYSLMCQKLILHKTYPCSLFPRDEALSENSLFFLVSVKILQGRGGAKFAVTHLNLSLKGIRQS